MNTKQLGWVNRMVACVSQSRYLWTSFILLVVFNVLMNAPGLPFSGAELTRVSGGFGPLDVTFGYSTSYVDQALAAYGAAGTAIYARYQLLDVFFPAIYAVFLSGLLFRLFHTRRSVLAYSYLLPIGGALLDYIENILLFTVVHTYPNASAALINVASLITRVKFVFPMLAVVALVVGGAQYMLARIRRRGVAA